MLREPSSPACIDARVLSPIIEVLGRDEAFGLLRDLVTAATQALPQMQIALREGHISELARLAHKLAGSCGSLGAVELQAALRALERASKGDDADAMAAAMQALPALVGALRDEVTPLLGLRSE